MDNNDNTNNSDSNGSTNSAQESAALEQRKSRFVEGILAFLESQAWDGDSLGGRTLKNIKSHDLKTVIQLYVEAGSIPLQDDLTDDMGEIVRLFFRRIVGYRLDLDDTGNLVSLHIGKESIESFEIDPVRRNWFDYLGFTNFCVDIHKCIRHLEKLETLKLDGCRSIPEELSEMPSLEKLIIFDCHQEQEWSEEERAVHSFPALTFQSLKHLAIRHLRSRTTDSFDPVLLSWIATSQFPWTESISISIDCVSGPRMTPELFNSLRANDSFGRVVTLDIEDRFGLEAYFPGLFLDVLPEATPSLKHCHLDMSHNSFHSSLLEIVSRLETGQYHPSLQSTLSSSLEGLRFDTSFYQQRQRDQDKHKQQEDIATMVKFLTFFKRLHEIPKLFRAPAHIEHLVKSNYLTAKTLTPDKTPTTLWPHILEWASKDFSHWVDDDSSDGALEEDTTMPQILDSTTIYKLLRPDTGNLGPALQSILESSNDRKRNFPPGDVPSCHNGREEVKKRKSV